ncbi:MAG TPA: hypothetical protein VG410_05710 [Solirubrobacteraceae bacterium]|jgi:Mrp family chromosome partitioning ATPase|nr:hypothetical protein [Solirubrobacteraceae bacterium]
MGINAQRGGSRLPDFGDNGSSSSGPQQQAISPYIRAVRRHWIVVLALTLVAGAVAAVTVQRSGYTYKATANVLVTPLPENPSYLDLGAVLDTGDPTRTVQTAAALVDTAQAASATAAKLGAGWTTNAVQKAITVDALGQTNVLAVTGSGSSASQAAQLTNTYTTTALDLEGAAVQRNIAAEIAKLQAEIASLPRAAAATTQSQSASLSAELGALDSLRSSGGDPTLSVSQAATVPASPSGTSHTLIVLLALLGGFAVASVAVLGIDFFGRPVRDQDEVEALFPLPVLASIPKVSHRGRQPLSPWMFPPVAFEQVRMLRAQLDLAVLSPVIMVTSADAGDGKTTLVAALAAAFAEGGDVIVVDLDLHRPSLATTLGVVQPHDETPGPLIPVPNLPRVKFLPLPPPGELTADELMTRLPILLAQAQRAAACVILDTAPIGQISDSLRVVGLSEAVVFVARPGHTDRRLLVRARDLLKRSLPRSGARAVGLVLVGQSAPGRYDYYPSATSNGVRHGAPLEQLLRARGRRAAPAADSHAELDDAF